MGPCGWALLEECGRYVPSLTRDLAPSDEVGFVTVERGLRLPRGTVDVLVAGAELGQFATGGQVRGVIAAAALAA